MGNNYTAKNAAGATITFFGRETGGIQAPQCELLGPDGNPLFPTAAAVGDADANPTTGRLGVTPQLWNEAAWERQHGNLERQLLASGSRTTTQTLADQTNRAGRGGALIVNVSDNSGGGSITPQLQVKCPVSGIYLPVWTALLAITTQTIFGYLFYPGAAGDWTEVIPMPLPRTFRFVLAVNNGAALVYSAAQLLML